MNQAKRALALRASFRRPNAITRAFARILTLLTTVAFAVSLMPAPSLAQSPPATSSLIVKLAAGLSAQEMSAVVARNGGIERSTVVALRLHVIEVAADQRDELLAKYRADPQVVRAEVNVARKSEALPSDPLYADQWALPKISWDLVFGSASPRASVVVAVLDTGVDATHSDLNGNVIPGTSILDGSNGMTDMNGHGTRVAGIVAARTNASPAEGIAGVAYAGVQIMPVAVLNTAGLGQDSDIIAGVVWAADHDADVILMAFSNPDYSESLQEAIDYAWSKDVLLVAAVGNQGVDASSFPAGDRGVIGVAATDESDQLASFSNYGPSVLLAAPGTNIVTTDLAGTYSSMNGTSGSAAIVAGAAAQLWALDPTLTNGIIVGRLARSADPAGTQSQTGNGRINLARAVLDTGTDFIQPAGAAPVGSGGPFVGPYQAAAIQTITTLASSPNPSLAGQFVTFTATITCSSSCTFPPGSSVSYVENANNGCNGGTTLGSTTSLTGSGLTRQAVLSTSTLTVGIHSIRACFNSANTSGNNAQSSVSIALSQVVNSAAATTLSVVPASGNYGGTVALTATLASSGSGVSGKTISFTLNGNSVGSATTNASGVATLANASLIGINVGTYATAVGAAFAGDSAFAASTGSASLTVNTASTTTSINAPTITYNGNASVTVTVTSAAGTPSGNVSLTVDGGAPLMQALSGGSATFTLTNPSAGDHALSAGYAAQGNFAASTGSASLTVNTASTTTSINAPTITYNANASVTVTVTSAVGTPSGNVSLTVDGGAPLTQALSGGSATFTLTSPSAGDHALSAGYPAQGNFAASSATGTLHVEKAPTSTSVTTSGSPSATGATVTFTATVVPAAASGAVEFFDSAKSLGTTALSVGIATLPTTALSAGSHSITAKYLGDVNYLGSTSPAITQLVDSPPASFADAYVTLQDDVLMIGAPGVLLNDLDTDMGQTLTAQLVSAPANASSFTLNGDGSFSYTPPVGFTGVTSFTYRASDGVLSSPTQTVTIAVSPPTATPLAQNDAYAASGTLGVPAPGVLDNDNGQGLTAVLFSGPVNAVTFTLNADGSFTYVPQTGFSGVDTFFYQAKNASNTTSNLAMVTITVLASGATMAANDAFSADEDTPLNISALGVLSNDSGATNATRVSGPLYGVLTLQPNGAFVYTPDPGFSGKDSFTYRATGGSVSSNLALATILVRTKTTTTISAPAVTYGSDAVVTVAVSASSATPIGDVTLSIDSGAAITRTLDANGKATFTFPGLSAVSHALSASYAAQGDFMASSATGTLDVNKKPASVTPDLKSKTYGSPDPTLTGTLTGFLAADNVVATYSRAPGEMVGGSPYTISATLSPAALLVNYDITYNTATFTIHKKDASVTPDAKSKIYGEADPPLTGSLDGFLAADNVLATYTRSAGETVAGTPYTISATLTPASVLGNYNITYNTANFTITRRPASVTPIAASKFYGDADPTFTGSLTGFLATDNVTAAYTRAAGEAVAGSPYTISATLSPASVLGNYDVTYNTASFTIKKRPASVTPNAASRTYGDADPQLTGSLTGFVAGDGVTATYSRAAGETVGTYLISAVLGPAAVLANYEITYNTANFTINKRAASVTPNVASKTYGDADPTLTGTLTNFVAGDGVMAAYTRTAGETVGTYTITAALGPVGVLANYDITYNTANFTINRRAASVTPNAASKTYGDADPMLNGTLTNFLATDGVTAAYSRTSGDAVGTYTINATLGPANVLGNYNVTYNTANFTISKRPITITADAKTKVYGNGDPALTYQVTNGSLAFSDTLTGGLNRALGENVGNYAIIQGTLTAGGNYALTYVGANFAITSRPVTVTADAKTKVFGYADPTLTYQITSGSLAFADSFSGAPARVAGENVGTYGIQQGSLVLNSNYNLTFVTATLTITQRPITVTADAKAKFVGNGDPTLTYQVTTGSLAFGDVFVGALARVAGESVGSYAIQQDTLALSSNYALTYVAAALTIVEVTVTGPVGPLSKGTPATVTASFPNTGTQAGPTCKFDWDDTTTTSTAAGSSNFAPWTCSQTQTYGAAGVYEVKVTVTDARTGATTVALQYVVIYDTGAGFATGGGWINSPPGAYAGNPSLVGKANFGFVSKYKQGQSVPTGETEFQFQAAGFNFHSTAYDWLVIAGSKAQFKGSGTVNGSGDYGFLLTATDGKINNGGGVDKFRIKVWSKATGTTVYDNNMGGSDDIDSANPQALGGGSITIHK